jgi:hypothetical protein
VGNGSVIGLESTTLDVVGIAVDAYCPQYSNENW